MAQNLLRTVLNTSRTGIVGLGALGRAGIVGLGARGGRAVQRLVDFTNTCFTGLASVGDIDLRAIGMTVLYFSWICTAAIASESSEASGNIPIVSNELINISRNENISPILQAIYICLVAVYRTMLSLDFRGAKLDPFSTIKIGYAQIITDYKDSDFSNALNDAANDPNKFHKTMQNFGKTYFGITWNGENPEVEQVLDVYVSVLTIINLRKNKNTIKDLAQ